jgi:hypothetical protein
VKGSGGNSRTYSAARVTPFPTATLEYNATNWHHAQARSVHGHRLSNMARLSIANAVISIEIDPSRSPYDDLEGFRDNITNLTSRFLLHCVLAGIGMR